LRVTVCETPDDPDGFAGAWKGLVEHVAQKKSELVLLPEMPFHPWPFRSSRFDPGVWKASVDDHEKWLARAGELGGTPVLGTMPVDLDGRRLNQGFLWTRDGGARRVHVKRYLPDDEGYHEASWYDRGDGSFTPFEAGRAKVGLLICSDIWAMGHAREYGRAGVHIVAVPHAAPRQSMERWVAAGKVVAVISGSFCIASNRSGPSPGPEFGGSGWVISPSGEVLGMTSREAPFTTVDLDLGLAERAKKTYPRDVLGPD
jgi:N-carbamoylputrescine amidase